MNTTNNYSPSSSIPLPWRWEDTPGAGLRIFGPVPFKAECGEFVLKEGDQPIFGIRWQGPDGKEQLIAWEVWLQCPPKEWTEMQRAYAAFIVKAVNNHDALVALLERARASLDMLVALHPAAGYDGVAYLVSDIDTALVAAKQESQK